MSEPNHMLHCSHLTDKLEVRHSVCSAPAHRIMVQGDGQRNPCVDTSYRKPIELNGISIPHPYPQGFENLYDRGRGRVRHRG